MNQTTGKIQGGEHIIAPEIIRQQSARQPSSATFGEILKEQYQQEIKYSGHAQSRMEERNIRLSESEQNRLAAAFEQVEKKGGRDSLVLMDSLAFVINARNRTVITAMTQDNLKERVFTKIDSAVIV